MGKESSFVVSRDFADLVSGFEWQMSRNRKKKVATPEKPEIAFKNGSKTVFRGEFVDTLFLT
jgi:hypothetical protein